MGIPYALLIQHLAGGVMTHIPHRTSALHSAQHCDTFMDAMSCCTMSLYLPQRGWLK